MDSIPIVIGEDTIMKQAHLKELISRDVSVLEGLKVATTARPDFAEFWRRQVDLCATAPLRLSMELVQSPFPNVQVFDALFEGLDQTPIRAWVLLPTMAPSESVPVVVHFHGSGQSRGEVHDHSRWLLAGFAVIVMDFRMQGGLTGSYTGFTGGNWPLDDIHMGVETPEGAYFRHVWTDALRCLAVAKAIRGVDASRIIVHGGSQGGATALAMAALAPWVRACLADVPSNCWIDKRIYDRSGGVGGNAAQYLRAHSEELDRLCATVSYFDNLNLADRIRCPVLMSCGLKDPICPPENVYAVYNRIPSPKEMYVYPFGEHDGGGTVHEVVKLNWLRRFRD